jgi:cell wall-associated NlpC family hydrolase
VKALLAAATCCLLLPVLVIGAAMGGVQLAQPSAAALTDIPTQYLALYQEAATELGLPWELLAAIGKVESDHGRNPASRKPNAAGAEGPMQFLPTTFAAYQWAAGDSKPNVYDPRDAIYAAAALLVDNGVRDDPRQAIYDYNHSAAYVNDVISWAAIYSDNGTTSSGSAAAVVGRAAPNAATSAAIGYALTQLGTPYLWGGNEPGGFDCSGLVQAAYQAGGIPLPRTAQQQYDAGTPLPNDTPLQAGDLVFFGSDTRHVEHVGILISPTEMVDAPHTGALIRVEPYRWPNYLAATRPAP